MTSWSNSHGVSLVEVLAAMTVFAVIAAGAAAGTIATVRGNSASRATTVASALIHDKIEQLRALDPSTNPADLNPGVHQDPLNPLTALGRAGGPYRRSWKVVADSPRKGLLEVQVAVSWNDPVPRSLVAATYVCRTPTCS